MPCKDCPYILFWAHWDGKSNILLNRDAKTCGTYFKAVGFNTPCNEIK